MTNISKTHRSQPTHKTQPKSDLPPAHIMYGIFMDRLGVMKNDVKAGIDLANVALKSGQLSTHDEAEVTKALGYLNKAQSHLNIPGGKVPKEIKAPTAFKPPSGGMIALYAVFMKTQMDDLKTSVRDTLGFVQTSLKSGQLKGTDLTDAKQASVDLKNALHSLGE